MTCWVVTTELVEATSVDVLGEAVGRESAFDGASGVIPAGDDDGHVAAGFGIEATRPSLVLAGGAGSFNTGPEDRDREMK